MAKIALLTLAYNAAKTLRRAVDSVLSQDMGDFTYYLIENGSCDETRTMIEEYAEKDARIIPFYFDQNYIYRAFDILKYIADENKDEYIAVLDSDDEYTPAAFGRLLRFAEENGLDFAAGGNMFIGAVTGNVLGARGVEENLIIDEKNFSSVSLRVYHAIMRPIWCKLFRTKKVAELDFRAFYNIRYGADTMFCLSMMKVCRNVGLLAGNHHNYYVSPASDSYKWDENRIKEDCMMDDFTRAFLIEKTGEVNSENDRFLNHVFINAITGTLEVLLKSKIPFNEKLQYALAIVSDEKVQKLFVFKDVYGLGTDEKICRPVKQLVSQKECRRPDTAETATKILICMYADLPQLIKPECLSCLIIKMPESLDFILSQDYTRLLERLQAWFKHHDPDDILLTELMIAVYQRLCKTDGELFQLLMDIRKKRPRCSEQLDIDALISGLLKKYRLLSPVSISLAAVIPRVIPFIMNGDFQKALDGFLKLSQNLEIDDSDAGAYLQFAQNLSASAENADAYIYFKKLWIEYLLDGLRYEEADKELEELSGMLPDDDDISAMQQRLENG